MAETRQEQLLRNALFEAMQTLHIIAADATKEPREMAWEEAERIRSVLGVEGGNEE